MEYARVDKNRAEKLKQFLLKKGLFAEGYPVVSEKAFVCFPITDTKEVGREFSKLELKQIKVNITNVFISCLFIVGPLTLNVYIQYNIYLSPNPKLKYNFR